MPPLLSSLSLVRPSREHLESYLAALGRGWSPDTLRAAAAQEELERIERDPDVFLAEQVDLEASRGLVLLPDGSRAARIPGVRSWLWDGEFCGSIGLRWQPGTADLPEYCLGHIGYSVVPWKRRLGYARKGLALMLPSAQQAGLPFVDLVTSADNLGSQRVIQANGGQLVERYYKPSHYGEQEILRFRIGLSA